MSDEDLAEIILTRLRDADTPSGMQDIVELTRDVEEQDRYQLHRVARRLQEQGFVEGDNFSGEALPARLSDRGRSAIENGEFRKLTQTAVWNLESKGQIAEAKE